MFYIMKIHHFLALCMVWFQSEGVQAVEYEVKRGTYPFMALLFYPDESIVESTGARFQRGAVLIGPQWLLSAAIDHTTMDDMPLGFPVKTLLARLGAVTLDANYTLNEDEEEQEREVIEIVRPSRHNVETWWLTDITLLKTLLPFADTAAVSPTTILMNHIDQNTTDCNILVFAKKSKGSSEEKVLMKLTVDLLPPSVDNCGSQFTDSMLCAFDSEETKNSKHDSDFCVGNAGGPLVCEGNVVGLQTYIENSCKPPHLYQLLASWEKMISCAIQEQCHADPNCDICTSVYKDVPYTNDTTVSSSPLTTFGMATVINEEGNESLHASSMTLDTPAIENETSASPTEENSEGETSTPELPTTSEYTTEYEVISSTDVTTSSDVTINTDGTTNADETTQTKVSTNTEISTNVEANETITSKETSISSSTTNSVESTITTTTTMTSADEASVPLKVKPAMRKKTCFSKYRGDSDTEEDTSRKMKVEVEAQQKPKLVEKHERTSGAQRFTSTECVLMYLSLLTCLVN